MSDINEMNEGVRWYVVHTYSGYENKVMVSIQKIVENRGLGELICDIRIPMEKVVTVKDGVEVETEQKLFPGYVLVKMVMTDETWHVVRNITGVTGFVGPGSRPTPLTPAEVERLMGSEEKQAKKREFKIGDNAVIVGDEFFEGMSGPISAISEDGSEITIIIQRSGRNMPYTNSQEHFKLD